MEDIPKPSSLWRADPTGDALYTISDLGIWLQGVYFLPGDWLIWTIATYVSPLADFLKVGAADYGGVLSGLLSALAWLGSILILGVAYQKVRDFDRRLTDAIKRLWAECLRRLRVGRALFAYRLRGGSKEKGKSESIELSEEVKLSNEELRVLRLHSQVDAGYALPLSELTTALKVSRDHARQMLDRLRKLNFLASTIGGEGESAYRLTRAGHAFLVFQQLAPEAKKR